MPDDDLLTLSLSLRDAQHVVAAEYGYPSWSHMKTHVERRENTSMLEMTVDQVKTSPQNYQRVVVLKAKGVNKLLPIWIGPAEAESIAAKLRDTEHPRPMTHDLMDSMISDLGATVTQVVVSELKNDTFFAKVVMQRNGTTIERDSRPSDAIALAVRTGAPIYTDEAVLDEAGIEFDPETSKPVTTNIGMSSTVSLTKLGNRFSERAKSVLIQAEGEAKQFGHTEIEPSDILFALLAETEGAGAKALVKLGVNLDETRQKLESQVERGESKSDEALEFSERSQRVLRLSRAEGYMLFHHYEGTEHILLGLIVADDESTSSVFKENDVEIETARAAVIEILDEVEASKG
jgi:hypothetical protein